MPRRASWRFTRGGCALAALLYVVTAMHAPTPVSAAEDAGPGGWSQGAALPAGRDFLAASTGPDGRIYAISGENESGSLDAVNVLAPGGAGWTAVAPLSTQRLGAATATGSDGRIYAMGGDITSSTVEAYSPAANVWSPVASLPTPRWGLAAAAGADGRIYAVGGYSQRSGGVLSTVEVYTPATNSWSSVANLSTPRWSLALATGSDGRIYAIGGCHALPCSEHTVSTVEAYTPATDTWTTVASLSTPRQHAAAARGADGRIYVMGGDAGGDPRAQVLDSVEVYTPQVDHWSTATPLPAPRSALAATTGLDGRIYAIGGTQMGTRAAATSVTIYDPGATSSVVACQFVLGFKALHDLDPVDMGDCTENEGHNPQNGDGLQHTTMGLAVWRKADNWTAFTNGYWTWINGPNGLARRLNTQRLPWEANSEGLPVVNHDAS